MKASDLCSTASNTKNEDEIDLDEEDSDEDVSKGNQDESTKKISLSLPPPKHELTTNESILPLKKFAMNLPPPVNSTEQEHSVPMDSTENNAPAEVSANKEPVKKTLKRRNAAIYNDEQE